MLSIDASDPSPGDTFGYSWAVSKNGSPFASGAGALIDFTPDDDANYEVQATVSDDDGGTTSVSSSVSVANAAPTAAIVGAPVHKVLPGELVSLTSVVTDPGLLDTHTFAWSVTRNGDPFASGTDDSFSFTPDAVGAYVVTLLATDNDGGTGEATITIEAISSSLSGLVWSDLDDDGQVDLGEAGIPGVMIHLTGTDDLGHTVNLSQLTDSDGAYVFLKLRPGTYSLAEIQPADFLDGKESLGTASGQLGLDRFSQIPLGANQDGFNYNFGELPRAGHSVQAGQTATIGYWQNRNGQKLIRSLNGGPGSTALGDWLAQTMPRFFGPSGHNLAGRSNEYVADLYQQLFKVKGQKLNAQVMATALAVYVPDSDLAGAAAAAYGFVVDQSGLASATWSIGDSGAAFGMGNGSVARVIELLRAADDRVVDGLLYGGDSILRDLANSVFDGINNAGDIG